MPVYHKQFVGVIRQAAQAAHVAQGHFQANVFPDGDDIEVHDAAYAVFGIRQGRLQTGAVLRIQAIE